MLPTRSLKRIRWEKIGMCMYGKTKNKVTLPSEPKTVLVDFLPFQSIKIVACHYCCVGGTSRELNWHPSFYIFFMEAHAPHTLFSVDYSENFLECNGIFSKHIFWKTYVLQYGFWSSTYRPVSMATTYTEIFNNLFFRFFRNLCNILHECDSSATPEKPGTNEGLTITIIILYNQNHGFGKCFCKLFTSQSIFCDGSQFSFFCLFLSVSET